MNPHTTLLIPLRFLILLALPLSIVLLRMLRLQKVDLVSFYFLSHFYFIFDFSIFRTLGLGLKVVGHTVTSGTFDGMVTTLITGLKRRK